MTLLDFLQKHGSKMGFLETAFLKNVFYEDYGDEPVSRYMPGFCATRAVKPT